MEEVSVNGLNDNCGLLVNSSRGIIYASKGSDFDQIAANVAKGLQKQMAFYLEKKGVL